MKEVLLRINPVRVAERLLSSDRRDMAWAHDLCTVSRFLHVDVWTRCPSADEVEKKLVPLMNRISVVLQEFADAGTILDARTRTQVNEYLVNSRRRLANITLNYLNGKPSAFIPEERLAAVRQRAHRIGPVGGARARR